MSVPWDSENVAAALKAAAAAPGGGGGGGALRRLVHLPSYGHVDLVWYDARPILDDVLRVSVVLPWRMSAQLPAGSGGERAARSETWGALRRRSARWAVAGPGKGDTSTGPNAQ